MVTLLSQAEIPFVFQTHTLTHTQREKRERVYAEEEYL